MKLSELIDETTNFKQIDLLSGKKIGIKPWKVKEEKELIFATEGLENLNDTRKEIIKFIKRCVDNTSLFNTLSNTDIVYTLIKLRQESKGSKIEYSYPCKCGLELSDDIDLTKDVKTVKFDSSPFMVNSDLTLSFKEVSYIDLEKLQDTYNKISEYNYYYMIKSIESVAYKGVVYDEFHEEDLIAFLDKISIDLDKLLNRVNNGISKITIAKTLKCGKCKNENVVDYGDLYHFLAF